MNFTLQDVFGVCLAFFIFPFVLLFPAYVISWALDLFEFRKRVVTTRYGISMIVSIAIMPILLYLPSLFFSFLITKLMLVVFFIAYLAITIEEFRNAYRDKKLILRLSHDQKLAFLLAGIWVFVIILSLADLQLGNRLYNTVVSYDLATRVSVVNAITRTGIPPVIPSYFPGHPEYITSLYYFWYIVCSLVDQFGAQLVDARMALIAGGAWCGLILISLITLYIKFRNNLSGDQAWRAALIGMILLTISGLDIIPVLLTMLQNQVLHGFIAPPGDIEHWNEQITAWIGSLFWVPHHVAAMIACLMGFLLFQYNRQQMLRRKIVATVLAGLAFASTVGLSTWVAITFSIFWCLWMFILLIQEKERSSFLLMIVAGLTALLVASPFLAGVLAGGMGGSGGFPVAFEVRKFYTVLPFIDSLSLLIQRIVYLICLPINYLLELGFFFFVGMLWIQHYRINKTVGNPYIVPEILMLCVVIAVCSFIRSAIFANDLGWRGWLLGQFVLLIWAIDIYNLYPFLTIRQTQFSHQKIKNIRLLTTLILIGFSTTALDVVLLKVWPIFSDTKIAGFAEKLSPDTKNGYRTLAGRLAYEFIRDQLPENIVIQPNPVDGEIDEPSGLYGTRQIAISANAPYNVPLNVLNENMKQISEIFVVENTKTWSQIDLICRKYFIDAIIVNDLDPLWTSLPILKQERNPLYQNQYYMVFNCGKNIQPP